MGDFIRFGSVGFVVSEMMMLDGEQKCIDSSHLVYLKSRVFNQMAANSQALAVCGEADVNGQLGRGPCYELKSFG